jgi:very-short-patch-repair endonuclease
LRERESSIKDRPGFTPGLFSQEAKTPYFTAVFLIGSTLIVEVDGRAQMTMRREHDVLRDEILRRLGYQIIHLTNDDVIRRSMLCVRQICKYLVQIEHSVGDSASS